MAASPNVTHSTAFRKSPINKTGVLRIGARSGSPEWATA